MAKANLNHIKELVPDARNARKHNPHNIGMIVDALQEIGAARSIVIDENNEILAGNGTIEAAAEAGITKMQVVEADGETIIAVRRTGLTPEQKTKLALYDNRTAELADWDTDVLRAIAEDIDLSDLFTADEISALMNETPDFAPVGIEEQGRLDEKKPHTCPNCGHEFTD